MAQEKKNVDHVVSRGEHNLRTQKLKADGTGYEDTMTCWQGDTAVDVAFAQTSEELPSGDNPAWDIEKGPVTADVTLTLYDIPLENYGDILSVAYSETDGVRIGEADTPTNFVGLSIDHTVKVNGVTSTNRLILYKVAFDLPEIKHETITKDSNSNMTVELKGKGYPVFYSKESGEQGRLTASKLNSVKHAAKYKAFDAGIVFPTELKA